MDEKGGWRNDVPTQAREYEKMFILQEKSNDL